MSDSVLLRFLDTGLINVGGDDAKLEKLQATSVELAVALKSHPDKTPAYSLIAFDPQAPPSDPVILESLEILKTKWPTYPNTLAGVPIGVIRPLLLNGLVEAAREDSRVAVAFVASARNVLPFMETGNEQSIWADAVHEIEALVDQRAEREWTTPSDIVIGELKIESPPTVKVSSNPVQVDREALLNKIRAAVSNQYLSNFNQMANWGNAFAPALTDAITEVIQAVADKSKIGPIDLSTPIQQITSAVSAHTKALVSAVSGATNGLQRRTNLIWWKQAMFSPSTQESYRKFPRTVSAALMALDLYQQIPIFSPASVSAFLEEAVRSIHSSDAEAKRPIRTLLRETSGHTAMLPLQQEAAVLYSAPAGRCPISALIAHPEKLVGLNDPQFRDLTGVTNETALTDAEWAKWIFRDLQAGRATKEAIKKKTGKTLA